MFRKMRRFKQELSSDECREVLRNEWRGTLAVAGDDDYPYCMPMDFFYDEEKNKIYYHGAGEGHKIDAIKRHDKVSFSVFEKEGSLFENDCFYHVKSVICFGRMRILDDPSEINSVSEKLARKYYSTVRNREKFFKVDEQVAEAMKEIPRVTILELSVEHMTGKLVYES